MVRGIEDSEEVESGCGEWEWILQIGSYSRGTHIGIGIRKGEIEYD